MGFSGGYSGFRVFKEGLFGQKGWKPAWRDPDPKPEYDIVVIGGGGKGMATAFYLAKEHGLTNVAVLEKGYIGGGNVGRNTTIVRANYFLPGNSEFYSHSLKLWEGMEQELNYNVMHSQRGLINLFHSDGQRDAFARRGNAMVNQGDDAILLDNRDQDEWLGESSSPYGKDFVPRKGRLPGAVWLEWYDLMDDAEVPAFKPPQAIRDIAASKGISPDDNIIIYCFKGARASNTFVALRQAGFTNLRIYLGSWNEWSKDPELPIESGIPGAAATPVKRALAG